MAKKRRSSPGPYLLHLELVAERIGDANAYPHSIPAIRHLKTLEFHPAVTFLVGENGSGKSTILEAVAVEYGLNPEGGSRNFNFATRASHSSLADCLRLAKTVSLPADSYFLRAESFYNVATEIDRVGATASYGGGSLHERSHGESFLALFENRFGDHGLYLLDEPEAALSPRRQFEFLAMMHGYVQRGGQFVIATHSPIIMAYPNARIYHLDGDGIHDIAYADTEHYLLTRRFLNNPERGIRELLED
jgi:predicted ATPase